MSELRSKCCGAEVEEAYAYESPVHHPDSPSFYYRCKKCGHPTEVEEKKEDEEL